MSNSSSKVVSCKYHFHFGQLSRSVSNNLEKTATRVKNGLRSENHPFVGFFICVTFTRCHSRWLATFLLLPAQEFSFGINVFSVVLVLTNQTVRTKRAVFARFWPNQSGGQNAQYLHLLRKKRDLLSIFQMSVCAPNGNDILSKRQVSLEKQPNVWVNGFPNANRAQQTQNFLSIWDSKLAVSTKAVCPLCDVNRATAHWYCGNLDQDVLRPIALRCIALRGRVKGARPAQGTSHLQLQAWRTAFCWQITASENDTSAARHAFVILFIPSKCTHFYFPCKARDCKKLFFWKKLKFAAIVGNLETKLEQSTQTVFLARSAASKQLCVQYPTKIWLSVRSVNPVLQSWNVPIVETFRDVWCSKQTRKQTCAPPKFNRLSKF